MIPIYKPYLVHYTSSAIDAINSEWISNHGKYITLASDMLKGMVGAKYCILMNNGTSATHCMFKALRYKYPNLQKIYVPNNVFVAPWNCCLMEYPASAMEVMRIDCNTLNIDVSDDYIRTLEPNSAVCIVHNLGNVVNVPRLKRLRPDLIFVEDNCEGLFGKYEGQYSGTASLCSSVSFYGNKTITTGEGGAFFTDDDDVYQYINNIYSHGMSSKRYIHCNLGTNFRMTNIQAGFLYDQLHDIKHILSLKKQVFNNYDTLLHKLIKSNVLTAIEHEVDTEHSRWMYAIIVPSRVYEHIEAHMKQNGVEIRPFFYDIHQHDYLHSVRNPHDNTVSTSITEHCILLPSYPELTLEQQTYICDKLNDYVQ
jgi:perosamine synthetase